MTGIRFSFVAILWFANCVSLNQYRENYDVYFTRVNCVFNYAVVSNSTTVCKRTAINRYNQTLNLSVTFLKDLSNVTAYVTCNYKFNVYKPLLINRIKINYCDLLLSNTAGKIPVIDLIRNICLKHGNILDNNRTCPLKAGVAYYLKDSNLNEADWPVFLPAGDFRVDCDLYTLQSGKHELLIQFKFFVTIKPKGAKLLAMG